MVAFYGLERVLQRELHDPGIGRSRDLSERVAAVEICVWVSGYEAVRHIEGLGSKLQFPGFANLEDARERHIQLPFSRTLDTKGPHVSERARSGLSERFWIQVIRGRVPVAIWVSKYLVGPLARRGSAHIAGLAAQGAVQPCNESKIVS